MKYYIIVCEKGLSEADARVIVGYGRIDEVIKEAEEKFVKKNYLVNVCIPVAEWQHTQRIDH